MFDNIVITTAMFMKKHGLKAERLAEAGKVLGVETTNDVSVMLERALNRYKGEPAMLALAAYVLGASVMNLSMPDEVGIGDPGLEPGTKLR